MSERLINDYVDRLNRTGETARLQGLDEDTAVFLRTIYAALQTEPPGDEVLVRLWQKALHNATIVARSEHMRNQNKSDAGATAILPMARLAAASRTVAIVASVAVLVFVVGLGVYFRSNDDNTAAPQGENGTRVLPTLAIPESITCHVGDDLDVPVTYRGDFIDAISSNAAIVDIEKIVDDGTGSGYLEIYCRAEGEARITVSVLPSEEGRVLPVTVLSPSGDYSLPQFVTVPEPVRCVEGETASIDITFEPAPNIGPPVGVAAISESQVIARIQRTYSDQASTGTVTIDCLAGGETTITVYIFRIGDVTLDDFSKAASATVGLTVEQDVVATPTVPTPVIVTPGTNPSPTDTVSRRPSTLPAPSVTPTASEYLKPIYTEPPPSTLDCVVGDVQRIEFGFQAAPGFPGDIGLAADLNGNSVLIQQASTDAVRSGYVEIRCATAGTSTVIIQIFRVGDVTETDLSKANLAQTTVHVVDASPTPPDFEASPTPTLSTATPTPLAYVKPSFTMPPPAAISCEVGEVRTFAVGFQAAPGFGGPIGVTARSATPSAVLIQSTSSDDVNTGSVTIECAGVGSSVVTTFIFRVGDVTTEDFSKANSAATTVNVTDVTTLTSPPTLDLPSTFYCGSPDYVAFHAYARPESDNSIAIRYTINTDTRNYQVGRADSFWNGTKQVLSLAYGCSRPGIYTITFEAFHYVIDNNELVRTSDSSFQDVTVSAHPDNAPQITNPPVSQSCTVGERVTVPLSFQQSPVLQETVDISASTLQSDIASVVNETSDGVGSGNISVECLSPGKATITITFSNRNSPPAAYHEMTITVSE